MAYPFSRLIRFTSDDHEIYFADTDLGIGCVVTAFAKFDDLLEGTNPRKKLISKLLSPLLRLDLPIQCVAGVNYRSAAIEVSGEGHSSMKTFTKPATAQVDPGDDILLDSFRAESWPDYQGALAFMTSKACRDITPAQAHNYILGYTIANDIVCRMHQFMRHANGQYFYAGQYDQLAPIGPALVSSAVWQRLKQGAKLVTRLNGKVVQESVIGEDMINSPEDVLSYMSRETTIPAGTVVITGTPAGAGLYRRPRGFLRDGDVVEVSIEGIGTLRNRIVSQEGQRSIADNLHDYETWKEDKNATHYLTPNEATRS